MNSHYVAAILALTSTLGLVAQVSHHNAVEASEVSLVGEVIDPVCYLTHDSIGKDHKACAEACVKQGISLAILEAKTGQIYVSLPADHSNPNATLKDFVAEEVKVTGTLYVKGGLKGLHVKTVERVR